MLECEECGEPAERGKSTCFACVPEDFDHAANYAWKQVQRSYDTDPRDGDRNEFGYRDEESSAEARMGA